MYHKPHILASKNNLRHEIQNGIQNSKFVGVYCVLHSVLRDLMSLFIKHIFLVKPYYIFVHAVPQTTREPGG